MTILITVGLGFLLLSLLFVSRTVRCTRRGQILRAGSACIGGIASATMASLVAILVFSYFTYTQLTREQRVSSIQFTRIAPFEFRARLMIDGELDRFFVLTGDEWQMDARLVTWKAPATVLGFDPIYRLDRLSGRYGDVDQERTQPRSVHALSPKPALDVWNVARRFPWLLPGVDAQYGAATYVPMLDGAVYDVSLSRDALIARPANDIAREAISTWQ